MKNSPVSSLPALLYVLSLCTFVLAIDGNDFLNIAVTIIASAYAYCYIYLFFYPSAKISLSLNLVVVVYLISRFIQLYSFHTYSSFQDLGDATSLHIPAALTIDDPLEYLFSMDYGFNGRLTHVYIYSITKLLSSLSISVTTQSIFTAVYVANTVLVLWSAKLAFSCSVRCYGRDVAIKSFLLLVFNPFLLSYSALIQKEAPLLFLSLLFLYLSLLVMSNFLRFVIYLPVLFAILVDRFVMVPFLLAYAVVLRPKCTSRYPLPLSSIGLYLMALFIMTRVFDFSVFSFLVESRQSGFAEDVSSSYVASNSLASNLLRVFLGPFLLPRYLLNSWEGLPLSALALSWAIVQFILYNLINILSLTLSNPVRSLFAGTLIAMSLTLPTASAFKFLASTLMIVLSHPELCLARRKLLSKSATS